MTRDSVKSAVMHSGNAFIMGQNDMTKRRKVVAYGRTGCKSSFDLPDPTSFSLSPPNSTVEATSELSPDILDTPDPSDSKKPPTSKSKLKARSTVSVIAPTQKSNPLDAIFDVPSSDDECKHSYSLTRGIGCGVKRVIRRQRITTQQSSDDFNQKQDLPILKKSKPPSNPKIVKSRKCKVLETSPVNEAIAPNNKISMMDKEALKRKSPIVTTETKLDDAPRKYRRTLSEGNSECLSSTGTVNPNEVTTSSPQNSPIKPNYSTIKAIDQYDQPILELDMGNIEFIPSTPPREIDSPSEGNLTTSVTPKQRELWSKLLSLEEENHRVVKRPNFEGKSATPSSSLPTGRKSRIVDTLKRSASSYERSKNSGHDNLDEFNTNTSNRDYGRMTPLFQLPSNSQTLSLTGNRSTHVTYGETRTFLQDEAKTIEEQLDLLFESSKTSNSQIVYEDNLDDSQGAIQSVHDLRSAGGQKRFADDLELLLDDIETNDIRSISRKRNAMRELAEKCLDKGFVERLCDGGYESRIIGLVGLENDGILMFTWAATVASLLGNSGSVSSVCGSLWTRLLSPLGRGRGILIDMFLDLRKGIMEMINETDKKLTKVAIESYRQFEVKVINNILRISNIPDKTDIIKISPRMLFLRVLELLVRKLRATGSLQRILDNATLQKIVNWGVELIGAEGLSLGAAVRLKSHSIIISILELESLGELELGNEILVGCLKLISHSLAGDLDGFEGTETASYALRLFLNLTNNNRETCALFCSAEGNILGLLYGNVLSLFEKLSDEAKHFSDKKVKKAAPDADNDVGNEMLSTDVLILTLGVLINLTEYNEDAQNWSLRSNSCGSGNDNDNNADEQLKECYLERFLTLFGEGRKFIASLSLDVLKAEANKSESLVCHLQVAHGYLAVLLGNICLENMILKRVIEFLKSERFGENEEEKGLHILADAIEEFMIYHEAVDSTAKRPMDNSNDSILDVQPTQTNAHDELWHGWTKRLERIVTRLKSFEKGILVE